jgi:hypothetical protein
MFDVVLPSVTGVEAVAPRALHASVSGPHFAEEEPLGARGAHRALGDVEQDGGQTRAGGTAFSKCWLIRQICVSNSHREITLPPRSWRPKLDRTFGKISSSNVFATATATVAVSSVAQSPLWTVSFRLENTVFISSQKHGFAPWRTNVLRSKLPHSDKTAANRLLKNLSTPVCSVAASITTSARPSV